MLLLVGYCHKGSIFDVYFLYISLCGSSLKNSTSMMQITTRRTKKCRLGSSLYWPNWFNQYQVDGKSDQAIGTPPISETDDIFPVSSQKLSPLPPVIQRRAQQPLVEKVRARVGGSLIQVQ